MKAKKITALLLGAVMTATAFTGCGGQNDSTDTNAGSKGAAEGEAVTLTLFDKNSGSNTFDDPVALAIQEKTGVTIAVENPTGDPLEKLNLMLTGQNYPDIVLMDRGNEIVDRYIEAGALIPLNDLIDQYGPHIKEMYGEVLTKSRYSDGQNYYLNNWYGVDPEASAGVLMRKDLLTEIVGEERANSTDPFTQSEYLDILRQFKEKYPTIDGKESIAITVDAESKNYEGSLFGMYGMTNYYVDESNQIQHRAKDPRYKEAVAFMNTLYAEGLLDKEWVVNKKEQWTQKLSAGNVFSTFCSYWDTDAANASLASTIGPDAKFYSYKVVADGVDASKTTYNGRSTLGWDAIAITTNCKNPEAAMKFIDYLVSEEGQYLMMWGIEGENWDMVDGKHVPHQDIIDGFNTDFDDTKLKTGIRKWTWFIKNGFGSDGTPYDVTAYEKSDVAQFANERFGESDRWDTADFTGLEPAGSSPEGLKWQKVKDIYDQNFPKIVNAADNAEAISVYEAMISEMDEAGLSDVESYMSKQYQERMKLWGKTE
ncbi:extracellular solute-binding protein [Parablautia muri]|uniref:Extracellular solute-binding protein n=1 Tax=Parablautia muri TaxID=2320879 RepID=A0A9X5BE43_9FIRM|nr:extracellular solute-binding protein [Parablautia muri]NBJ92012.1 extracellular solute-binding protein [Parablautia muri]